MALNFDIECARKALTDPNALWNAFNWCNTAQGAPFWAIEYHNRTISPEAREILEKMIADHETANKETSVMFKPGKEYKTRDGRKVRIYATDAGGSHPVHGAIYEDNEWYCESWASDGRFMIGSADTMADIMLPEPEKVTIWVNVYPYSLGGNFDTREDADRNASSDRIACVPLTYFKGEGLK